MLVDEKSEINMKMIISNYYWINNKQKGIISTCQSKRSQQHLQIGFSCCTQLQTHSSTHPRP